MASRSLRVEFVEVIHVAAYPPFIGRPLWNALFERCGTFFVYFL
jgi:hypothetical protein